MRILTRVNFVWLVVYAVLMSSAVSALCVARQWSLRELSDGKSQRDWQAWREETARQARGRGPVLRREATGTEPPMLVLMRDHFSLSLVGVVGLGSVLYFALMVMLRGALRTPPPPAERHVEGKACSSQP
jgi:hypothetical protein